MGLIASGSLLAHVTKRQAPWPLYASLRLVIAICGITTQLHGSPVTSARRSTSVLAKSIPFPLTKAPVERYFDSLAASTIPKNLLLRFCGLLFFDSIYSQGGCYRRAFAFLMPLLRLAVHHAFQTFLNRSTPHFCFTRGYTTFGRS